MNLMTLKQDENITQNYVLLKLLDKSKASK